MNEMVFNPEMLTLGRQAREMTQEELATRAGLTQGRISKVEHGLVAPPEETVARLAAVLEFPREFFYQEGHSYTPPIRYHRKRARVGQKLLDKIHAEINIRALQVRQLLKSAEFSPELVLRQTDPEEFFGQVEEIARAVRSAWRLPRGPIPNMVRLLERAGVIVVPMRFGVSEVDAITQIVPDLPPLIFVNQEAPMDRLRFTLAHELGHLIMHEFPNPGMEEEANRFAAEFLMPADEIAPQLSRVSLPVLAALKKVWRVSMAALLETAKRIGAITQRQYVRLRTELSQRGYLKREPAELDVPREEPALLRSIISFHIERLNYGLNDLARVLFDFPEKVRAFYLPTPPRGLQLVG